MSSVANTQVYCDCDREIHIFKLRIFVLFCLARLVPEKKTFFFIDSHPKHKQVFKLNFTLSKIQVVLQS